MDKYVKVWYKSSPISTVILCYAEASLFGMTPGKVMLENNGLPGKWMVKFYVYRMKGNKKSEVTRRTFLHFGTFYNELVQLPEQSISKLPYRKIDLTIILDLLDTRRMIPSSIIYDHQYFNRLRDGF